MPAENALVPIHLDNAQADQNLSDKARAIVERNAYAIIKSQGTDPEDMHDEPLLTLVLADNSESMNAKRTALGMTFAHDEDPDSNANLVRICQIKTIDGLMAQAHPGKIYLSTQVFNPIRIPRSRTVARPLDIDLSSTVVVDAYHPLAEAIRLTPDNFYTKGATPLYDRTVQVCSSALYEAQRVIDEYKNPRTATLIITDGAQYPYRSTNSATDCAEVISSMITAGRHIVAAIGIDDGKTNFKEVFRSMGIQDQWILTSDNTPEEIAASINRFTVAVSQASKVDQQEFKLLTAGGFNEITPYN